MVEKAAFSLKQRNPDVLTSIANLSNDEVFTPPSFANQMLDTIEEAWAKSNDGAIIWEDRKVTFLDPFTKSGVFLREITSRLSEGLKKQIPDDQERVDHILTKQVFGVAITELTALLARRSVYCSKHANGKHSICSDFDTPQGNIWFERTEHTWVGGKEKVITVDDDGNEIEKALDGTCKFCGAKQKEHERGLEDESHAYSLIHTNDPTAWVKSTFGEDMQFDVIVGNPPYQLNDGGGKGTSAGPIYDQFVEKAIALTPRFLSLVIPARWFSGGKGLDGFRETMLNDRRIRAIEDFPDASDVFPGVQIKGGVCYFLWNRDHEGDAVITTHDKGQVLSTMERPLLETGADVLIRYNEAVSLVKRVFAIEGQREKLVYPSGKGFAELVSVRNPYSLNSGFQGLPSNQKGDITVFRVGSPTSTSFEKVEKSTHSIDKWKVFIPFLASGSDSFPHPILGKPFVGPPYSVCTESYLLIGPLASEHEATNVISYIHSRFFRFLVLQKKPSQNATKKVYEFVPRQDFSQPWTDEELYAKYKLTQEEIDFIERMIRPMELEGA